MPEQMLLSGVTGLLLQKREGAYFLHRHDDDRVCEINSDMMRQLVAGAPDLRAIEVGSVEEARTLLRDAKEVARATRLFLILLDPDEGDDGLEAIADIAEARLAADGVLVDVLWAMLIAPLPHDARLERVKLLSRRRHNLEVLRSSLVSLQITAGLVSHLIERTASEGFPSLFQGDRFRDELRREGWVQRLTAANNAKLIEVIEAAIVEAAPVDKVGAISTVFSAYTRGVRASALGAVSESKVPSDKGHGLAVPGSDKRVASGKRRVGALKFFNTEKGFGFIQPQDGDDAYVDIKAVARFGLTSLNQEQRIEFKLRTSKERREATELSKLGSRRDD